MGLSSRVIVVFLVLILFICESHGQSSSPAPNPRNLTGILEKGGQFTTFIRLLVETDVGDQIFNQLNSSTEGLTVLAPTDNAFNNLKAGTLNDLSRQDQVNLILYHVIPKFYTLTELLTVSNPVRTQYSQDGLNFTGKSNQQVNVSSGIVETQVNNPLSQTRPLAVYQLDSVLLPPSLFGAKPPASASAPPPSSNTTTPANTTKAEAPSTAASIPTNLGLLFLSLFAIHNILS